MPLGEPSLVTLFCALGNIHQVLVGRSYIGDRLSTVAFDAIQKESSYDFLIKSRVQALLVQTQ